MKIRIKDNAKQIYIAYSVGYSDEFARMLEAVQGQVLEVETRFLFRDQYNTAPIPGVTDLGLRIMDAWVAEVIDDIRPQKIRCQWCGKISDASEGFLDICIHCGKSEYIQRFDTVVFWSQRRRGY